MLVAMLFMMLHNSFPHVHYAHDDHKVVHTEHHHHGHSHHHHDHDEKENDHNSDQEHDGFFNLLFGNHRHIHLAHEHVQVILTEKQSFSIEKSFFDGNSEVFALTARLVYNIGSSPPKKGSRHYHNPFLLNCSLRAPPSIV
jgi:hypothetical protein